MKDNLYQLAGKVSIPEEDRKAFNRKALLLLDKCGIRKTQKIKLKGKELTVVEPALWDEEGIVAFDYSVFEKKVREISTLNLYTDNYVRRTAAMLNLALR